MRDVERGFRARLARASASRSRRRRRRHWKVGGVLTAAAIIAGGVIFGIAGGGGTGRSPRAKTRPPRGSPSGSRNRSIERMAASVGETSRRASGPENRSWSRTSMTSRQSAIGSGWRRRGASRWTASHIQTTEGSSGESRDFPVTPWWLAHSASGIQPTVECWAKPSTAGHTSTKPSTAGAPGHGRETWADS